MFNDHNEVCASLVMPKLDSQNSPKRSQFIKINKELQERGKRSVKKMLSLQKRMQRSYGEKVMPL